MRFDEFVASLSAMSSKQVPPWVPSGDNTLRPLSASDVAAPHPGTRAKNCLLGIVVLVVLILTLIRLLLWHFYSMHGH
ncbi:hypothetical protein AAZX31_07G059200 [Glycine max]